MRSGAIAYGMTLLLMIASMGSAGAVNSASPEPSDGILPGLEPAGLMRDPAVEPDPAAARASSDVQYGEVSNQTRVRIAVVPFDYRDAYQVGPFDDRLGEVDCSMKGVYARCTYTQNAEIAQGDAPPEPTASAVASR